MAAPGLPCVHCGLCLDTCPTYRLLGSEADSPRGRIAIMEGIDKGELELDDDAALHLSRCLGCLACETACPSGVSYGKRLEEFRPRLAERRDGASVWRDGASLWKDTVRRAYTNDAVVGTGLRVANLLDRAGLEQARRRVPALGLLPAAAVSPDAELTPLRRSRRHQPPRAKARAAVLTGCVGDRLLPEINRDTVEVLQRNGVEVVEAPGQGCCGALALHAGRRGEAVSLAAANAAAFRRAGVDFIVSTAAGCGALLHEYGDLAGEDGAWLAERSRDISELLVEVGFESPRPLEARGIVAYHDACHLLHARGVASAPRRVVEAAVGRAPVDLGENALCCGSAGSYNVDHPVLSAELGARKAELLRERKATLLAVGNVGCMLQIEKAARMAGLPTVVRHPVQLLAEAYRRADDADRAAAAPKPRAAVAERGAAADEASQEHAAPRAAARR